MSDFAKRLQYLDTIKFFMIMLMVFCHCLSTYPSLYNPNVIGKIVYDFVYLFHMPMFVLLCGYFFKRNKDKLINYASCVDGLLLYILFQLLWVVLRRDFSIESILNPRPTLWFLLCLPLWKFFATMTRKIPMNLLLVMAILFSEISAIISYPDVIHKFFTCLVYFTVGMFCYEKNFFEKIRKKKYLIPTSCFILFIAFVYYYLRIDSYQFVLGRNSFCDSANISLSLVKKFCFQFLSVIMCFAIVVACPSNRIIANWGRFTLGVYLIHLFVLHICMWVGNVFFSPHYICVGLYSIITIVLCIFVSMTKVGQLIIHPLRFEYKSNSFKLSSPIFAIVRGEND